MSEFEKEREIVLKAQNGDEDAKIRLYEKYLPVIMKTANMYRMKGVLWEDLLSSSSEGFWVALSKHDPNLGYLGKYAKYWCREYCRKEFGKHVHIPKDKLKKDETVIIEFDEKYIQIEHWPPNEEKIMYIMEQIEMLVEELFDEREKYIWERKFTDEKVKGAILAEELGITEQYVSKIYSNCLKKIKAHLKALEWEA